MLSRRRLKQQYCTSTWKQFATNNDHVCHQKQSAGTNGDRSTCDQESGLPVRWKDCLLGFQNENLPILHKAAKLDAFLVAKGVSHQLQDINKVCTQACCLKKRTKIAIVMAKHHLLIRQSTVILMKPRTDRLRTPQDLSIEEAQQGNQAKTPSWCTFEKILCQVQPSSIFQKPTFLDN